MAGLGRKEFNAGDILLASEVQGYLQDQAVMVFDDAAARGSAIPTPSEGMLTYNKDTDALELYDGSAFGPVGSDAGLIHIETQTFSGVASFSFSNDVFTDTYENYRMLIVDNGTPSSNPFVNWRGRIAGVDTSTANYNSQQITAGATTISGARVASATSGNISRFSGATATTLEIYAPKRAVPTRITAFGWNNANNGFIELFGSLYTLNTSFDSITITIASGVLTGEAYLYGYAN